MNGVDLDISLELWLSSEIFLQISTLEEWIPRFRRVE
jgi:hypothetical protein